MYTIVLSDQEREFVNQINKHLFERFKIDQSVFYSSAYHPQTNGLFEIFNQTLQCRLVKLVNDNQDNNWDELLDSILFVYRTPKQKSI